MKAIFSKTLVIFSVIVISSCDDYLEPEPISFISQEFFFADDDDLDVGILNIYDGLQGDNDQQIVDFRSTQIEYMLTEMRSDNARARGGGDATSDFQQFEVYEVNTNNIIVQNYYESMYNVIFRANLILDNLDAASEARRGEFEGEAKFVRAYVYFQLVRLFGPVPMPLKVISPDDDAAIAFTRVATDVVYAQIIEDLQVAVENLNNQFKTRASKAAAQALLAKVYLTLAADGQMALYEEARLLCDEIISSGEYELMDDYGEIFTIEKNDEIIFAIDYIENNELTSQNFSWETSDLGDRRLNYTTENIRSVWDSREETVRDVRLASIIDGQFMNTKYSTNNPTGPLQSGNDWIVLRYADVLLMYVEAVLAGGSVTNNATAISYYDAVRSRAGFLLPSLSITKAELLEERRMELSFENQRLFDLIRFNEAINVLSAHADATGGQFQNTDLLLPIPQNERNLSGDFNMPQNPGY
ncbi:MAG: RagB/SusD family nutrient uptake outer membrane protein, partial [Bacteroidota bacterium]